MLPIAGVQRKWGLDKQIYIIVKSDIQQTRKRQWSGRFKNLINY